MTREQATMEFARLVKELGKSMNDVKPEQTARWIKTLEKMRYEKGRLAIDAVIDQWEDTRFPPIGFFNARARQIDHEGVPNASAYSQDDGYTPWHRTDEATYAMWRQKQIEFMNLPVPLPGEPDEFDNEDERIEAMEARYWAYVHDEDGYRRKCERVWAQMWASGSNQTQPNERQPELVEMGR